MVMQVLYASLNNWTLDGASANIQLDNTHTHTHAHTARFEPVAASQTFLEAQVANRQVANTLTDTN